MRPTMMKPSEAQQDEMKRTLTCFRVPLSHPLKGEVRRKQCQVRSRTALGLSDNSLMPGTVFASGIANG